MPACQCENCKKSIEGRWDCHQHRDELHVSDGSTVWHHEQGQLCYWEVHYDCILYYPIQFNSKASAYNWVKSGTIADIQEGMSILQVGFSRLAFENRKQ